MNELLTGIVGSTAYGLAHENSDVDRLGVYAVDTVELHGMHIPKETHVRTKPDITLHEAAKFARLAVKCNPTVMELMWLPDDLYETVSPLGYQLIDIRSSFLSADRVRKAYFGYAVEQFRKLAQRNDGTFGPDLKHRTAKHARHMHRLLIQGLDLWRTGRLPLHLGEHVGTVRSFGERVADGDTEHARSVLHAYEIAFGSRPTVLPAVADEAVVVRWLNQVRADYYTPLK